MKNFYAVPFLLIAAAWGWSAFAPAAVTPPPRDANVPDTNTPAATEQWAQLSAADDVVLNRATNGHFYADADIGGTPVRFLVDTGASAIALTAKDAEQIGIDWNDNELVHVGRGVSGDVMGIRIKLDSVQIGNFEARDVQAVIIPQGLDVSLLGQSFLSKIAQVNIADDRMVLSEAS